MTASPVSVSGSDRVSALRTAAAVQRPINVSFAGVQRGPDAADVTSLATLFRRLASARVSSANPAFDSEVRRTTDAIRSALATAPGVGGLSDGPLTFASTIGSPGLLGGVKVVEKPFNVSDVRVAGLNLGAGEEYTLDVAVTQSAQRGALYLSLGLTFGFQQPETTLDLGGAGQNFNSTLTIEVATRSGTRLISFSSGQTLPQIRNALQIAAGDLGVSVELDRSSTNGGIRISSQGYGKDEFVSVRVVGPTTVVDQSGGTNTTGVYGYEPDAAFTVAGDGGPIASFLNAPSPIRDFGQDIAGTINGAEAFGFGTSLFGANLDNTRISIVLNQRRGSGGGFQSLGQLGPIILQGTGSFVGRDDDADGRPRFPFEVFG